MDIEKFLSEITALHGTSGDEQEVAKYVAEAFRPLCDEVIITPLFSVIAHKKGTGPKVMLCAHIDEIGMMVSKIEEDGLLRMQRIGGVDPRILPGMRVRVEGKKTLIGVIGAQSPHLKSDKDTNYDFEETLFIDLGMPADEVKKSVEPGDKVYYEHRFLKLKNGRYATKTADDRACVAILLKTAESLKKLKTDVDIYFVASSQEEIGSYGASTAAYRIDPDYAIALDVTHATTPGAPKDKTHALDSSVASMGPFINPYLRKKLEDAAKEINVELQTAVVRSYTSTDADDIAFVRGAVPTVLLELPLRYMHTNVELFDMHALTETARLLTYYLCTVSDAWEAELWS